METETVAPFELRIAVPQPPLRAGEPVPLRVELTHITDGVAKLEHWSQWFEFEIRITGPDGRELPRTRFGNLAYRVRDAAVTGATTLARGERYLCEIPLTRLFDLTLSGKYHVALQREIRAPSDDNWVTVVSNPIEFELQE